MSTSVSRRPFHESIVDVIAAAEPSEMKILALLIKTTKIPKDHEKIIGSWAARCVELQLKNVDFGIPQDVAKQKPSSPTPTAYTVTVDYTKSLDEMKAAGEYDFTNDDITSVNFPQTSKDGVVETEIMLIHYGKSMSTDAVLADFDSQGLRSATIAELLVLGAKEKELQRQFPLVALGSVLRIGRRRDCPCLYRHSAKRSLSLSWDDGDWSASCRFPAVRK